jgi:cytochrome P450
MQSDLGVRDVDVDWDQPDDLYWDPFDYKLHENAFPTWKRMRDEAPIYYNEKYDFWALSRFQDVLDTYINWKSYSSAQGDILEIIRGSKGENDFSLANMISEDPPIQQIHRSMLSRAFTPKAVETIANRVRATTIRVLDDYAKAGRIDFVRDLGAHVAGTAIGSMLGVPDSDLPRVLEYTDGIQTQNEDDPFDDSEFLKHSSAQFAYYVEQFQARRKDPTDDIMSALATLEFTDEHGVTRPLSDVEAVGVTMLLTGGGYETMARYTGWVGATLAEFPDERQKLVDRPELIPDAVDEILRFQPPSHANARVSTKDVTWYGREIPEGSVFLLIPGAAGRDERQYPDPDTFDVERQFERHLAFGFGIHYCIGAALARMEGRIILEEVTKRIPSWEVDWDNAEFIHAGSMVRGYSSLPATF